MTWKEDNERDKNDGDTLDVVFCGSRTITQRQSEGRISRSAATRLQLLKIKHEEYHASTSRNIALAILRDIKDTPKRKKDKPEFVNDLRRKLLILHDYNCNTTQVKGKFPYSKQLILLLLRYVQLEHDTLYSPKNYNIQYEKEVERRVLCLLEVMLIDAVTKFGYKNTLHATSKCVLRVLNKVNPEYRTEDKFVGFLITKLLKKLGLLDEITKIKDSKGALSMKSLLHNPTVQLLSTASIDDLSDCDSEESIEVCGYFESCKDESATSPTTKSQNERFKLEVPVKDPSMNQVLTIEVVHDDIQDEDLYMMYIFPEVKTKTKCKSSSKFHLNDEKCSFLDFLDENKPDVTDDFVNSGVQLDDRNTSDNDAIKSTNYNHLNTSNCNKPITFTSQNGGNVGNNNIVVIDDDDDNDIQIIDDKSSVKLNTSIEIKTQSALLSTVTLNVIDIISDDDETSAAPDVNNFVIDIDEEDDMDKFNNVLASTLDIAEKPNAGDNQVNEISSSEIFDTENDDSSLHTSETENLHSNVPFNVRNENYRVNQIERFVTTISSGGDVPYSNIEISSTTGRSYERQVIEETYSRKSSRRRKENCNFHSFELGECSNSYRFIHAENDSNLLVSDESCLVNKHKISKKDVNPNYKNVPSVKLHTRPELLESDTRSIRDQSCIEYNIFATNVSRQHLLKKSTNSRENNEHRSIGTSAKHLNLCPLNDIQGEKKMDIEIESKKDAQKLLTLPKPLEAPTCSKFMSRNTTEYDESKVLNKISKDREIINSIDGIKSYEYDNVFNDNVRNNYQQVDVEYTKKDISDNSQLLQCTKTHQAIVFETYVENTSECNIKSRDTPISYSDDTAQLEYREDNTEKVSCGSALIKSTNTDNIEAPCETEQNLTEIECEIQKNDVQDYIQNDKLQIQFATSDQAIIERDNNVQAPQLSNIKNIEPTIQNLNPLQLYEQEYEIHSENVNVYKHEEIIVDCNKSNELSLTLLRTEVSDTVAPLQFNVNKKNDTFAMDGRNNVIPNIHDSYDDVGIREPVSNPSNEMREKCLKSDELQCNPILSDTYEKEYCDLKRSENLEIEIKQKLQPDNDLENTSTDINNIVVFGECCEQNYDYNISIDSSENILCNENDVYDSVSVGCIEEIVFSDKSCESDRNHDCNTIEEAVILDAHCKYKIPDANCENNASFNDVLKLTETHYSLEIHDKSVISILEHTVANSDVLIEENTVPDNLQEYLLQPEKFNKDHELGNNIGCASQIYELHDEPIVPGCVTKNYTNKTDEESIDQKLISETLLLKVKKSEENKTLYNNISSGVTYPGTLSKFNLADETVDKEIISEHALENPTVQIDGVSSSCLIKNNAMQNEIKNNVETTNNFIDDELMKEITSVETFGRNNETLASNVSNFESSIEESNIINETVINEEETEILIEGELECETVSITESGILKNNQFVTSVGQEENFTKNNEYLHSNISSCKIGSADEIVVEGNNQISNSNKLSESKIEILNTNDNHYSNSVSQSLTINNNHSVLNSTIEDKEVTSSALQIEISVYGENLYRNDVSSSSLIKIGHNDKDEINKIVTDDKVTQVEKDHCSSIISVSESGTNIVTATDAIMSDELENKQASMSKTEIFGNNTSLPCSTGSYDAEPAEISENKSENESSIITETTHFTSAAMILENKAHCTKIQEKALNEREDEDMDEITTVVINQPLDGEEDSGILSNCNKIIKDKKEIAVTVIQDEESNENLSSNYGFKQDFNITEAIIKDNHDSCHVEESSQSEVGTFKDHEDISLHHKFQNTQSQVILNAENNCNKFIGRKAERSINNEDRSTDGIKEKSDIKKIVTAKETPNIRKTDPSHLSNKESSIVNYCINDEQNKDVIDQEDSTQMICRQSVLESSTKNSDMIPNDDQVEKITNIIIDQKYENDTTRNDNDAYEFLDEIKSYSHCSVAARVIAGDEELCVIYKNDSVKTNFINDANEDVPISEYSSNILDTTSLSVLAKVASEQEILKVESQSLQENISKTESKQNRSRLKIPSKHFAARKVRSPKAKQTGIRKTLPRAAKLNVQIDYSNSGSEKRNTRSTKPNDFIKQHKNKVKCKPNEFKENVCHQPPNHIYAAAHVPDLNTTLSEDSCDSFKDNLVIAEDAKHELFTNSNLQCGLNEPNLREISMYDESTTEDGLVLIRSEILNTNEEINPILISIPDTDDHGVYYQILQEIEEINASDADKEYENADNDNELCQSTSIPEIKNNINHDARLNSEIKEPDFGKQNNLSKLEMESPTKILDAIPTTSVLEEFHDNKLKNFEDKDLPPHTSEMPLHDRDSVNNIESINESISPPTDHSIENILNISPRILCSDKSESDVLKPNDNSKKNEVLDMKSNCSKDYIESKIINNSTLQDDCNSLVDMCLQDINTNTKKQTFEDQLIFSHDGEILEPNINEITYETVDVIVRNCELPSEKKYQLNKTTIHDYKITSKEIILCENKRETTQTPIRTKAAMKSYDKSKFNPYVRISRIVDLEDFRLKYKNSLMKLDTMTNMDINIAGGRTLRSKSCDGNLKTSLKDRRHSLHINVQCNVNSLACLKPDVKEIKEDKRSYTKIEDQDQVCEIKTKLVKKNIEDIVTKIKIGKVNKKCKSNQENNLEDLKNYVPVEEGTSYPRKKPRKRLTSPRKAKIDNLRKQNKKDVCDVKDKIDLTRNTDAFTDVLVEKNIIINKCDDVQINVNEGTESNSMKEETKRYDVSEQIGKGKECDIDFQDKIQLSQTVSTEKIGDCANVLKVQGGTIQKFKEGQESNIQKQKSRRDEVCLQNQVLPIVDLTLKICDTTNKAQQISLEKCDDVLNFNKEMESEKTQKLKRKKIKPIIKKREINLSVETKNTTKRKTKRHMGKQNKIGKVSEQSAVIKKVEDVQANLNKRTESNTLKQKTKKDVSDQMRKGKEIASNVNVQVDLIENTCDGAYNQYTPPVEESKTATESDYIKVNPKTGSPTPKLITKRDVGKQNRKRHEVVACKGNLKDTFLPSLTNLTNKTCDEAYKVESTEGKVGIEKICERDQINFSVETDKKGMANELTGQNTNEEIIGSAIDKQDTHQSSQQVVEKNIIGTNGEEVQINLSKATENNARNEIIPSNIDLQEKSQMDITKNAFDVTNNLYATEDIQVNHVNECKARTKRTKRDVSKQNKKEKEIIVSNEFVQDQIQSSDMNLTDNARQDAFELHAPTTKGSVIGTKLKDVQIRYKKKRESKTRKQRIKQYASGQNRKRKQVKVKQIETNQQNLKTDNMSGQDGKGTHTDYQDDVRSRKVVLDVPILQEIITDKCQDIQIITNEQTESEGEKGTFSSEPNDTGRDVCNINCHVKINSTKIICDKDLQNTVQSSDVNLTEITQNVTNGVQQQFAINKCETREQCTKRDDSSQKEVEIQASKIDLTKNAPKKHVPVVHESLIKYEDIKMNEEKSSKNDFPSEPTRKEKDIIDCNLNPHNIQSSVIDLIDSATFQEVVVKEGNDEFNAEGVVQNHKTKIFDHDVDLHKKLESSNTCLPEIAASTLITKHEQFAANEEPKNNHVAIGKKEVENAESVVITDGNVLSHKDYTNETDRSKVFEISDRSTHCETENNSFNENQNIDIISEIISVHKASTQLRCDSIVETVTVIENKTLDDAAYISTENENIVNVCRKSHTSKQGVSKYEINVSNKSEELEYVNTTIDYSQNIIEPENTIIDSKHQSLPDFIIPDIFENKLSAKELNDELVEITDINTIVQASNKQVRVSEKLIVENETQSTASESVIESSILPPTSESEEIDGKIHLPIRVESLTSECEPEPDTGDDDATKVAEEHLKDQNVPDENVKYHTNESLICEQKIDNEDIRTDCIPSITKIENNSNLNITTVEKVPEMEDTPPSNLDMGLTDLNFMGLKRHSTELGESSKKCKIETMPVIKIENLKLSVKNKLEKAQLELKTKEKLAKKSEVSTKQTKRRLKKRIVAVPQNVKDTVRDNEKVLRQNVSFAYQKQCNVKQGNDNCLDTNEIIQSNSYELKDCGKMRNKTNVIEIEQLQRNSVDDSNLQSAVEEKRGEKSAAVNEINIKHQDDTSSQIQSVMVLKLNNGKYNEKLDLVNESPVEEKEKSVPVCEIKVKLQENTALEIQSETSLKLNAEEIDIIGHGHLPKSSGEKQDETPVCETNMKLLEDSTPQINSDTMLKLNDENYNEKMDLGTEYPVEKKGGEISIPVCEKRQEHSTAQIQSKTVTELNHEELDLGDGFESHQQKSHVEEKKDEISALPVLETKLNLHEDAPQIQSAVMVHLNNQQHSAIEAGASTKPSCSVINEMNKSDLFTEVKTGKIDDAVKITTRDLLSCCIESICDETAYLQQENLLIDNMEANYDATHELMVEPKHLNTTCDLQEELHSTEYILKDNLAIKVDTENVSLNNFQESHIISKKSEAFKELSCSVKTDDIVDVSKMSSAICELPDSIPAIIDDVRSTNITKSLTTLESEHVSSNEDLQEVLIFDKRDASDISPSGISNFVTSNICSLETTVVENFDLTATSASEAIVPETYVNADDMISIDMNDRNQLTSTASSLVSEQFGILPDKATEQQGDVNNTDMLNNNQQLMPNDYKDVHLVINPKEIITTASTTSIVTSHTDELENICIENDSPSPMRLVPPDIINTSVPLSDTSSTALNIITSEMSNFDSSQILTSSVSLCSTRLTTSVSFVNDLQVSNVEENSTSNKNFDTIDVDETPLTILKVLGTIQIGSGTSDHDYSLGGPLLSGKCENNDLNQSNNSLSDLKNEKESNEDLDNSPVDTENMFPFSEQVCITSLMGNNLTQESSRTLDDSPVDSGNDYQLCEQDHQLNFSFIENQEVTQSLDDSTNIQENMQDSISDLNIEMNLKQEQETEGNITSLINDFKSQGCYEYSQPTLMSIEKMNKLLHSNPQADDINVAIASLNSLLNTTSNQKNEEGKDDGIFQFDDANNSDECTVSSANDFAVSSLVKLGVQSNSFPLANFALNDIEQICFTDIEDPVAVSVSGVDIQIASESSHITADFTKEGTSLTTPKKVKVKYNKYEFASTDNIFSESDFNCVQNSAIEGDINLSKTNKIKNSVRATDNKASSTKTDQAEVSKSGGNKQTFTVQRRISSDLKAKILADIKVKSPGKINNSDESAFAVRRNNKTPVSAPPKKKIIAPPQIDKKVVLPEKVEADNISTECIEFEFASTDNIFSESDLNCAQNSTIEGDINLSKSNKINSVRATDNRDSSTKTDQTSSNKQTFTVQRNISSDLKAKIPADIKVKSPGKINNGDESAFALRRNNKTPVSASPKKKIISAPQIEAKTVLPEMDNISTERILGKSLLTLVVQPLVNPSKYDNKTTVPKANIEDITKDKLNKLLDSLPIGKASYENFKQKPVSNVVLNTNINLKDPIKKSMENLIELKLNNVQSPKSIRETLKAASTFLKKQDVRTIEHINDTFKDKYDDIKSRQRKTTNKLIDNYSHGKLLRVEEDAKSKTKSDKPKTMKKSISVVSKVDKKEKRKTYADEEVLTDLLLCKKSKIKPKSLVDYDESSLSDDVSKHHKQRQYTSDEDDRMNKIKRDSDDDLEIASKKRKMKHEDRLNSDETDALFDRLRQEGNINKLQEQMKDTILNSHNVDARRRLVRCVSEKKYSTAELRKSEVYTKGITEGTNRSNEPSAGSKPSKSSVSASQTKTTQSTSSYSNSHHPARETERYYNQYVDRSRHTVAEYRDKRREHLSGGNYSRYPPQPDQKYISRGRSPSSRHCGSSNRRPCFSEPRQSECAQYNSAHGSRLQPRRDISVPSYLSYLSNIRIGNPRKPTTSTTNDHSWIDNISKFLPPPNVSFQSPDNRDNDGKRT